VANLSAGVTTDVSNVSVVRAEAITVPLLATVKALFISIQLL
jgi:hypothetical protein